MCSCLCLCVLRHPEKVEKPVCGFRNVTVCTFNVPVYAGTTRTCVETCTRGAGTHEDVLNLHTVTFLNPHTRRQGVIVSSAYQHLPTYGHHLAPEVHQRNQWILPIFSLRIGREQHVADSSNHSRCLIKLFSFSNPEGNCGGNQL